jgi:hypothetical protein
MEEANSLPTFSWLGTEYRFTLRNLLGDNACLQKMLGNLGGSAHRRCTCCDIDFSQRDKLWTWQAIEQAKPKSILALAKAWATGTAAAMGMKNQSAFVPSLERLNLDPKLKEWAKQFVVGIDPLHNIKGHWLSVIARLRGMKDKFDYQHFSDLVDQHVQRCLVSDLDGAHMRKLLVCWKDVLEPALKVSVEELPIWQKFFHHWTEVSPAIKCMPQLTVSLM